MASRLPGQDPLSGTPDGQSAAGARDAAASARDDAADVRDHEAAGAEVGQRAKMDRLLATADRAAAALDRQDAAVRATAAAERDRAAQARDAASAETAGEDQAEDDRRFAAGDRAASALDRQGAAADRHGAVLDLENAYRDELTGLLVRDAGWDQLSQAIDRAQRHGAPLVVAFLDVDHLKQVNDQQGHAVGDGLLRAAGLALRTGLRSYDVVFRYGGDEFVCGLPDASLAEAERRFGDVAAVLSDTMGASFSLGIVQLRDGEGTAAVISRADRAMYDQRASERSGAQSPGPAA